MNGNDVRHGLASSITARRLTPGKLGDVHTNSVQLDRLTSFNTLVVGVKPFAIPCAIIAYRQTPST
jgi:hypothetical protein